MAKKRRFVEVDVTEVVRHKVQFYTDLVDGFDIEQRAIDYIRGWEDGEFWDECDHDPEYDANGFEEVSPTSGKGEPNFTKKERKEIAKGNLDIVVEKRKSKRDSLGPPKTESTMGRTDYAE